jgi:hypothetical protein
MPQKFIKVKTKSESEANDLQRQHNKLLTKWALMPEKTPNQIQAKRAIGERVLAIKEKLKTI